MFERYTEKARRVIFFARYEASQFGAAQIEAEHILLGLIREDKHLTTRFFSRSQGTVESIRKEIEGRTILRERISTSVDLPLSLEAKRVLAFAAEESERLGHRHIGTEHLLLGLLREENSIAAEILYERGLRLSDIRHDLMRQANLERSASAKRETPHLVADGGGVAVPYVPQPGDPGQAGVERAVARLRPLQRQHQRRRRVRGDGHRARRGP